MLETIRGTAWLISQEDSVRLRLRRMGPRHRLLPTRHLTQRDPLQLTHTTAVFHLLTSLALSILNVVTLALRLILLPLPTGDLNIRHLKAIQHQDDLRRHRHRRHRDLLRGDMIQDTMASHLAEKVGIAIVTLPPVVILKALLPHFSNNLRRHCITTITLLVSGWTEATTEPLN